MEKRYCKRIPAILDVLLYHNNIPVVSCKTQDIGKDGLFVESGPLAYGKDVILKVEFHTDSEDDNTSHLLPAMIIHKSKKGMGLMLPGGDSNAMKAWRHKVTKNATLNSTKQTYKHPDVNGEFDHTVKNCKTDRKSAYAAN